MASILFLGGLALAIGIMDGGEVGGEGVWTGETRTELPRGKGNNRGFGEKVKGLEGPAVSLFIKPVTLTRGGVIKPEVGKYYEVQGLNHGTTSGERGATRFSPSNPRPGGENSTGTLPKFKVQETPAEGITVE
jgi:hypothetical protein